MPDSRILLCRSKAFSLAGYGVQQPRSLEILEPFQCIYDSTHIIAVHRTEIPEAERFEERTSEIIHERRLGRTHQVLHLVTKPALPHRIPDSCLYPVIGRVSGKSQQMIVDSSEILVNAAVVVIEYYEDIALAGPDIVQTFQSQTSSKGSVTYQSDHFLVNALHFCSHRQSESC